MNDKNDAEYEPVSFVTNLRALEEETPSKPEKPAFSIQLYYFYVLLFNFSDYLLLFLLRNYYFAYYGPNGPANQPSNNQDPNDPSAGYDTEIDYNRYRDGEIIKYFFYRTLSFAVLVYMNQNSIYKMRFLFGKMFSAYSGRFFVLYGVLVWLGMINVLSAFILTNVILLVNTQSYYKLIAHVLKGYPLKKLDYKFMGLFTAFILFFFIYKLEKLGNVVLLVICGYFFYTREEIARVKLEHEEVELLSYFTKGIVLLLFVLKFIINYSYDKMTLSFKDIVVGLVICGLDYFRVFCYRNIGEATSDIDTNYYRDVNALILIFIAFVFDLFMITGEYSFWHYLFSLIGIGAVGYYNKAFLLHVASYRFSKKEETNELEIELKSDL